MIEKRLVQWYASDAGVDLDIAEREVILTYVLRILYDDGLLDHLAFRVGLRSASCTWVARAGSVLTWTSPRWAMSHRMR